MLISAALGIAHPEQYELSRQCLQEVARNPEFVELSTQWSLAFNVVTIVANRETPIHRDIYSGGQGILDGLLNLGGGRFTVIEFPGLGLRLQYASRALLLFSGNTHSHGVSVSEDERVCLAFYARKAMLHKHSLRLPCPSRLQTLLDFHKI